MGLWTRIGEYTPQVWILCQDAPPNVGCDVVLVISVVIAANHKLAKGAQYFLYRTCCVGLRCGLWYLQMGSDLGTWSAMRQNRPPASCKLAGAAATRTTKNLSNILNQHKSTLIEVRAMIVYDQAGCIWIGIDIVFRSLVRLSKWFLQIECNGSKLDPLIDGWLEMIEQPSLQSNRLLQTNLPIPRVGAIGCTSHPVVRILRLLCYQFGSGSVACSKTLPFHTCNDRQSWFSYNSACHWKEWDMFVLWVYEVLSPLWLLHCQCSHAHFFVMVAMDQDWSNARTIIFNNIWCKLWFRRWF